MYHLFHNSMWKVVRIAKTSDCKISWRVFLQGTVAQLCLAKPKAPEDPRGSRSDPKFIFVNLETYPTSFVMKVLCDDFYAPRSRWLARMVTSIVTTGPKMTNARRILNGIFQMSHCPICLSLLKLWYYYTKAYYFNQVKLFSSRGSTIVYFFHFPF